MPSLLPQGRWQIALEMYGDALNSAEGRLRSLFESHQATESLWL
jgi:hypothetical protein